MKGFVMSGLKTFSCIVILCGAMANTAIADPRIEARGELGRFLGGAVGGAVGGAMGVAVGGAVGGAVFGPAGSTWGGRIGGTFGGGVGREFGREIGDRVEDYIRGVDREPQTREPQAPREPIRDFYDYGYSFGHAW
ncbi:pantothenate kinase [Helicobacter pylori]|uniref:pantothenate kinase n=1 Tax=Helicobacter pylori TaxID=210 RepID=UPI001BB44D66|nr:pantothenate kinase [Helicobacter pylori]WRC84847.1 pantothenate kinase [Helicobacter pylori]